MVKINTSNYKLNVGS